MKLTRKLKRNKLFNVFYKAPDEYTAGDKANGSQTWKIELALDKSNPDKYETFCYTASSESVNDSMETFYESCGGGISNNAITSQDYTVSYESYIAKGRLSEILDQKKLNYSDRQNIGVRISNSLSNRIMMFQGIITIGDITRGPNELNKISGEIKVYSGEIIHIPMMDLSVGAEGSIRYIDSTDKTISTKYSLDLNDETNTAVVEVAKADEDTVVVYSSTEELIEGDDISLELGSLISPLEPSTVYVVNLVNGGNVLYSTLMYTKAAPAFRETDPSYAADKADLAGKTTPKDGGTKKVK